jgi:hypothetical protein
MVDTNNPNNFPASAFPGGNSGGGLDSGLQLLIANLQDVVQAVNNLNVTLATVFPQQGIVAATANAGTGTLPATPQVFLEVTISGTEYKIPMYLP